MPHVSAAGGRVSRSLGQTRIVLNRGGGGRPLRHFSWQIAVRWYLYGNTRIAPRGVPSFRAPSGYATATLAPSKGRLMRCTVDGLTPNRSAMTRNARPPRSRQSLTDSFLQRGGYRRSTKTLPLAPGPRKSGQLHPLARNRGLRPFVSQQRGIRIATGFVSRHCWYLLSGTGRSRPRWPAPLVEPGAVFAHLLALRRRRVALAG